ncbi:MAG: hypothetical protein RBT63_00470 [Bdellovibrionales bacterium]|jgi:hypothetical protein|nr:hypothetical protein [Bdellovibrionales bacterium]
MLKFNFIWVSIILLCLLFWFGVATAVLKLVVAEKDAEIEKLKHKVAMLNDQNRKRSLAMYRERSAKLEAELAEFARMREVE